ncbi:hypothetical protein QBC47DRAFT_432335 [Echria macrotheca]|uniref:DUF7918 domain-containing protein n=1 Tax=Echria macrotheca TaxID=438768 RepID=A0AAJ0BB51_9PEZI|nr:hypothetical protein QBC47DRAFT_432335 [Echria macrotheca]
MAVIECIPGIEVTIETDGQPLKEFDPCPHHDISTKQSFDLPTTNGSSRPQPIPHVVKYIEAKPGKPFGFRWKKFEHFEYRSHHIAVRARVNSRGDEGTSISPEEELVQTARAKYSGVLQVELFHMRAGGEVPREWTRHSPPELNFHEKVLKGSGVDCGVRYRTMDGLLKLGVVPKPSPREEVQNMTNEEVRTLAERLLEQQRTRESAMGANIKTEGLRGIKREHEKDPMDDTEFAFRYKTRRLSGGKLEVDLTDD